MRILWQGQVHPPAAARLPHLDPQRQGHLSQGDRERLCNARLGGGGGLGRMSVFGNRAWEIILRPGELRMATASVIQLRG